MPEKDGERLIGEAFNKGLGATHTRILCNTDAVHGHYVPATDARESHLFVDINSETARMVPERDLAA
jgi:hypothetical protein